MSNFKMDDYVPVNERIEAFYAAFPNGSLQSEIVEHSESRVTVKAFAYRDGSDERPGTGHSSEQIPGATSFTKGSELENAETSAWGRAIAALGFEVKRGIASQDEMRNKQPERGSGGQRAKGGAASSQGATPSASAPAPVQRTAEEQALLDQILAAPGMTTARMTIMADGVGVPKTRRANADELREMIARFIEQPAGEPKSPAGDGGGDGGSDLPVADNAVSEGHSGTATPTEAVPPSPQSAVPTDLMDDILAVTNGEDVTPEPGTVEDAILRAEAKAAKAKVRA